MPAQLSVISPLYSAGSVPYNTLFARNFQYLASFSFSLFPFFFPIPVIEVSSWNWRRRSRSTKFRDHIIWSNPHWSSGRSGWYRAATLFRCLTKHEPILLRHRRISSRSSLYKNWAFDNRDNLEFLLRVSYYVTSETWTLDRCNGNPGRVREKWWLGHKYSARTTHTYLVARKMNIYEPE